MNVLRAMALLTMAVGVSACTEEVEQDEDIGEAAGAMINYEVAGASGSGWVRSYGTFDFYNALNVSNVLNKTMKVVGAAFFQQITGLPDTAANRQLCEDSHVKVFTYKKLNGTWVPWLAPQTVFAVPVRQGGHIVDCSADFESALTFFAVSTDLEIDTFGYAADGSLTLKQSTALVQ